MDTAKPYAIPKETVKEAFELVKANGGSSGVDKQTIAEFEEKLEDNLYKLWNRMSSGSYFPVSVKAVKIPKKNGGERILGVPTVTDRVAQMVVKLKFEPEVERHFLPDSYGYRPGKSALDAIRVTRERCWKYDWVLEFDIRGMFDNIDHELMMKAVRKHTQEKWIELYIERWLKAPIEKEGKLEEREKGTPQGGVISPVLSNLFMHYAFDLWMKRSNPGNPWCRYADDGLVHCKTLKEAEAIRESLGQRLKDCGLELHPTKTRIIYCKDINRKGKHEVVKFDFLGYTFRPRLSKGPGQGNLFISFGPSVSASAKKSMRAKIRRDGIRNRTEWSMNEIAKHYNPVLEGWLRYYGAYNRSSLYPVWRHFNVTLISWAMKKYKRLKGSMTKAILFLVDVSRRQPHLFAHWKSGMVGSFA